MYFLAAVVLILNKVTSCLHASFNKLQKKIDTKFLNFFKDNLCDLKLVFLKNKFQTSLNSHQILTKYFKNVSL